MNMASKNKKYNLLIAAFNGAAIYLILHFGGIYKWWAFGLLIGAEALLYYLFIKKIKKQ